jgi:hypothetical protein
VVSDGSAVQPSSIVSPAHSVDIQQQRPIITRAQHGIHKPKTYTDGTVRWCQLANTVSEEPSTVDEALGDTKWVSAMDAEHQGLLRNKTWR